ncbi:uncharacterized protein L969DRAFT_88240 [Mixia osmundae IAM 14324]|uniref:RRM domain-containing protein n=1 Tax=Mixia osmundae (strain CBS 9802 / IAM 14324 / JCM 22182 / KY 12970) TaxID=764103 RepID=G7E8I6_MIXOS|nr:uncharacterized protein L969DRAFT_88240 [Mixia osmundae IAM 14324]KEI38886.1 hypothetical protein L969DRAFT_88240 [Mixia osmundae IAM 14324]GAA99146.1 hypothetical protein E5Q_05837 [Mixia osmundae IAM 14324]
MYGGGRSGQGGDLRNAALAGKTNVIFIGNLPYDATEQQLAEHFSSAGPVVGARLVFDHDTGKAKGFGFVEFYDANVATSAVRNLNGEQFLGRALRVDHAEPKEGSAPRTNPIRQANNAPPAMARAMAVGAPPGVNLAPGASAVDSISETLATLPPNELLDIMSQMKSLVTTSPDQAKALLAGNPQLTYALFQAMLMMNIVDPIVLQRMLAPAAGQAPPQSVQQQPQLPPQQPMFSQALPQRPYGQAPVTGLPPNPAQYAQPPQQQRGPPMPPQPQYHNPPPMQRPPMQQQQPPQQAPAPLIDERQRMLQQVLSMPQEQVDALPEGQRVAIMQIRESARLAAQGR